MTLESEIERLTSIDIERQASAKAQLKNTTVDSFGWHNITVTVKDRVTKQPKAILGKVNGFVKAGEMCALMGPSGCGKTTLLNVLAHRANYGTQLNGSTYVNGAVPSLTTFRNLSCYVEQEDALVGSLTVKETIYFAARLAHKSNMSKMERIERIGGLLDSLGLQAQADTIVGTPIRKGISGGQKRRLSVASQLITNPKILCLDEPTSGLDSAASWEVVSFIKAVAKLNNLIVVASIHQPSTSTFALFDKLLLLSGGKTQYFGPARSIGKYFDGVGHPIPEHTNPAEFVLELLNIDFGHEREQVQRRLASLQQQWTNSEEAGRLAKEIEASIQEEKLVPTGAATHRTGNLASDVLTLVHRSFIKSYRDVVAYGIRIAMYLGLALMMGTVWLRLKPDQESIIPLTNAIFFGGAFMSFMAVAYVPAFLEDRGTFVKERANGLYGATAFIVSNFIIGLPYLFLISISFSVIAYWLSNLQPTANAFFMWVMWLFLDLVAAESLVVFVASGFPNFVLALAIIAFANGLWMCVDGFMLSPEILNPFWYYVFHFIDYQAYVFQGMIVNEFGNRTYTCGSKCQCTYQTPLADQCLIDGKAVLAVYGYKTGGVGKSVGILLAIVAGYRLLSWVTLSLRK